MPDNIHFKTKRYMKTRYGLYMIAILPVLCWSCMQMTELPPVSEELGSISKIVNTRAADDGLMQEGVILVKVTGKNAIQEIKEVCGEDIVSAERLFPAAKGKEELEARFGLDRWYELALSASGRGTAAVAEALNGMVSVEAIQYNALFTRASDCVVYPFEGTSAAAPASRAAYNGTFNDPSLSAQWHYVNNGNASVCASVYKGADINVADVWRNITTGDRSIIVAVVDEGVKYSHPDLKDNMWVNEKELNGQPGVDDDGNGYVDDIYGLNFVTGGDITWDERDASGKGDSGHGTHCAGTIAAVNNNGIGVCGVAGGSGSNDGVRIMSCQIFSGTRSGSGSSSVTARAIKYAADMGASIISCSYGYTGGTYTSDNGYQNGNGGRNLAEYDAIKYFENSSNNDVLDGNIAIFAAGNDSLPYAAYPGALNDIISVSAFGPDYLPTYYTNYGPGCNITAPGGEAYLKPWTSYNSMVLSTVPSELNKGNDYGYMQGTSMACPHVSGVVALGLSYALRLGKKFTTQKFKEMILASANDFDSYLTRGKDYASTAPSDAQSLKPAQFRHKMGTGAIDAWRLMMNIEGIPCLVAETGKRQWLDLSEYFGTASVTLTYLGLEISAADKAALGLAEEPEIKYGRLYIHPTKLGSGKIRITAVGGGEAVGGGNRPTGGMEISQEISVISRSFKSSNGGWL